ncbi:hypothetical protein, partial [Paenibacillus terrigena]|uniref:hypothetical protein n=1 Tax=Paenibacillus terrigena TaxID=369333 RepID=UPI0028D18769
MSQLDTNRDVLKKNLTARKKKIGKKRTQLKCKTTHKKNVCKKKERTRCKPIPKRKVFKKKSTIKTRSSIISHNDSAATANETSTSTSGATNTSD